MLSLYKLRVTRDLLTPSGADAVGFSEWTQAKGFIVLARSEGEARSLAAAEGSHGGPWWTDPKHSTCELVSLDGEPRIIMADEPTR